MGEGGVIADRFELWRPHLQSVAYSMLGSVGEAEDAVQECWLRLDRSSPDAINDLRAWLTTAVGRICLDMLRARKSRREHHAGIWLPEPLITQKFIAACSNGDLSGLLDVMTPDAWGDIDLGPAAARLDVVTGARSVAGNLLRFWGQGATLVSHPVAGQPAVLAFIRRELAGVLVFTMRGELIQAVHVIGDPRKLDFLRSQLTALA